MACSYEQKKVLYEIANVSFGSQSGNSFFNLITNYLGKKKELLCPQINSKLQGVNGHTLTLFGTIPEMCYLLLFWSSSGPHTHDLFKIIKTEICLFMYVFIFTKYLGREIFFVYIDVKNHVLKNAS